MPTKLNILWINDNPITAELMVFMYATNSLRFSWWKNIRIIVWGATIKLLCENEKMQSLVQEFVEAGGEVSACLSCADKLGLVEQLQDIKNIEIDYMGGPLTEIINKNSNNEEVFMTL